MDNIAKLISAALVIGRVAMSRGVFVTYQEHPLRGYRFELRLEGISPRGGLARLQRWLPAGTVVSYRGSLEELVNDEIDALKADWELYNRE